MGLAFSLLGKEVKGGGGKDNPSKFSPKIIIRIIK
jgi:hypothetical protein